jgi:hypothetical protein
MTRLKLKKKKTLFKSPIFGLDTKTYWLTDRQSQSDFDFDYQHDCRVNLWNREWLNRFRNLTWQTWQLISGNYFSSILLQKYKIISNGRREILQHCNYECYHSPQGRALQNLKKKWKEKIKEMKRNALHIASILVLVFPYDRWQSLWHKQIAVLRDARCKYWMECIPYSRLTSPDVEESDKQRYYIPCHSRCHLVYYGKHLFAVYLTML